ncbi:uncharacterized protein I303_104216 [Kwoniella dejecticola CBS 10117]|uniref:Uncharacterized protein n=1 Tax=Kwoniella dejecticola CBS 10117 TaxID=1296121 RepID=A0A1A6A5Y6_9TREE|nr:uncharacterized protein I303_04808 [Kwoniella dejecticola CBS 10117]OBR85472.1 hypothetical protein I303_04808 [Kwoniella dejecticola CBS 10117]
MTPQLSAHDQITLHLNTTAETIRTFERSLWSSAPTEPPDTWVETSRDEFDTLLPRVESLADTRALRTRFDALYEHITRLRTEFSYYAKLQNANEAFQELSRLREIRDEMPIFDPHASSRNEHAEERVTSEDCVRQLRRLVDAEKAITKDPEMWAFLGRLARDHNHWARGQYASWFSRQGAMTDMASRMGFPLPNLT